MTPILILFALTVLQGCMASLSSRSRNRSHMVYHMVCQILSHLAWLLVISSLLKELMVNDLSPPVAVAYIAGYTLGSLLGAKISMFIEKQLGATT